MTDQVTITTTNTQSFSWDHVLSTWGVLYDLPGGVIRAQMRHPVVSDPTQFDPLVIKEFSTEDGSIELTQTAAVGIITIPTQPSANSILSFNGTIVTIVASGASGNQVNLGASLPITLSNILAFLQASADAQIASCTYSLSAQNLNVFYNTVGDVGNSFTIASTIGGAKLSGDTLQGGGYIMNMNAPLAETKNWLGDYVFDVRLENGTTFVTLVDGTISVSQGKTR